MRWFAVACVLGATLGTARAGKSPEPGTDYVLVEPQRWRTAGVAGAIYLNRCAAGCTLRLDRDDATLDASTIPEQTGPLAPFEFGDTIWDEVVACVRQTYAPYDVEIVTDPPSGSDYIEVMIAGSPAELGLGANILGIAPLTTDCSAQQNVITFAFSNIHLDGDVIDICATAAHEAGHAFGLDHEFLCQDPMTYLRDCGEKQFLNIAAECGEFDGTRECRCDATQNSFQKLIGELGQGTFPAAPQVTIQAPQAGTVVGNGVIVFARTVEPRVIIRTELWINGWRWSDGGATPDQDLFQIPLPAGVPDGVLDIEVRAINDVGAEGIARITVTKGAPCTSAATCAAEQSCDGAGRCVYATPAGQLGEDCGRDLDCASTRCQSDGSHRICTDDCMVGFGTGCPGEFTCLPAATATAGVCWPDAYIGGGGGCCDAGAAGGPGGAAVLALGVVLVIARRRRDARATR